MVAGRGGMPTGPTKVAMSGKGRTTREAAPDAGRALRHRGIRLDPLCMRATCHGRILALSGIDFRLLEVFLTHVGTVLGREDLLRLAWPEGGAPPDPRSVDVRVSRLRKALAEAGCDRVLHTVRGHGYRLE